MSVFARRDASPATATSHDCRFETKMLLPGSPGKGLMFLLAIMKTSANPFIFLLLALVLAGCAAGNAPATSRQPGAASSSAPPPATAIAPAIADIDMAVEAPSLNKRLEILVSIAERPSLPPVAQLYLVNKTLEGLQTMENEAAVILMALIQNPSFSNTARQAIIRHQFNKADVQTDILTAIQKRGGWKR